MGGEKVEPSLLVAFADQTTLHGIRSMVYTPQKCLKYLWLIVFLLALFGIMYTGWGVVYQYSRQATTSVNDQYQVVTQFPKVAYCPANWIDPTKWNAAFGQQNIPFFLASFLYPYNVDFDGAPNPEQSFKDLNMTTEEVAMRVAYEIPDVVRQVGTRPQKGYAANASRIEVNYRGVCYVIDNDQLINVKEGVRHLTLEIEVVRKEPILDLNGNPIQTGLEDSWLVGSAHAGPLGAENVGTLPGSVYQVMLQHKDMRLLLTRTQKCSDTLDDRLVCLRKEIATICEAKGEPAVMDLNGNGPKIGSTSSWLPGNQHCFRNPQVQEKLADLEKACPLPCKSVTYGPCAYQIGVTAQDVTKVKFKFPKPYQGILMEESFAYSTSSFLSNIGGQISLFSGASVLTIVQTGCFCLKRCHKRKNG